MERGKFITIEGMDGSGKSSHLEFLRDGLQARGLQVVMSREPGGVPLSEKLRELILHEPMSVFSELCLVSAARREHIAQKIEPALARGEWVISDRFYDSTTAYQAYARGFDKRMVAYFIRHATQGLKPDLTLYFDLDAEQAARRRTGRGNESDRFEQQDLIFFKSVRKGFLQAAKREPERIVMINSAMPIEQVRVAAWREITTHFGLAA
jgi:dTMP kinase